MNSLQVEERSTVGSSSASKDPFLLYVLLVVVTIYITMSLYFIFNTVSRLESTSRAVGLDRKAEATPEPDRT